LPPGADVFIQKSLETWDGHSETQPLLDCLVLLPFEDVESKSEYGEVVSSI
jgi:hypothetical protein